MEVRSGNADDERSTHPDERAVILGSTIERDDIRLNNLRNESFKTHIIHDQVKVQDSIDRLWWEERRKEDEASTAL